MQTLVKDYEISDYGIDNCQYFQGHGVAFTPYEQCALGYGDTYAEALEDALEQAAMMGYDLQLTPDDEPTQWEGKGPTVEDVHAKYCEEEDHSGCEHELNYYVGLRW